MAHDAHRDSVFPRRPIDYFVTPFARFLHIETTSGVVLLVCSLIALAAANSPIAEAYLSFWRTEVELRFGAYEFEHSLKHLVNDGLMAIFFLAKAGVLVGSVVSASIGLSLLWKYLPKQAV